MAAMALLCAHAEIPGKSTRADDTLEAAFASPPTEVRPRTWWHWVSGNVSKEGVTLDLEAMKRVGIAEAQIFNVAAGPQGPVKIYSDEWRQLTQHAIREADRLGIGLAILNCAGWTESGGPWVTPERSMQFVYSYETTVTGGSRVTVAFPRDSQKGWRDIAVWAFPTTPDDRVWQDAGKPQVTSNPSIQNTEALCDGNLGSIVRLPATPLPASADGRPRTLRFFQLTFDRPQAFASAMLTRDDVRGTLLELQASDNGRNFRPLGRFGPTGFISFPVTSARIWRLLCIDMKKSNELALREFKLGGYRMDKIQAKAAYVSDLTSHIPSTQPMRGDVKIDPATMVNLTDRLKSDGTLEWDAPAGEWTILRFGHASTGQKNVPAAPEATGLECDKLDRDAVASHWNDGQMGSVIKDNAPLVGKSLKSVLCDSWEVGCQNWTPKMRDEFMKRCGYDPLPWLPVMTGRVVGSMDQSERFLWDLRRVVADLLAENHYGTLRDQAHRNGMPLYAEAPGNFFVRSPVADALQCKARTDVPMGEFWLEGPGTSDDVKEAASAAHINGYRWAAAESFTAGRQSAAWRNDPYGIKALGDKYFCIGLNRVVFHRYAHQPFTDKTPGMTLGPWGLNFERTQTWWEQGRAYMDYLARCQWLLSCGTFVADICYFYGEWAPNFLQNRDKLNPAIPAGYDYDACDAETLMKATVRAEDGSVLLPGGTAYRVLAVAAVDRMTPRTLTKLRDLARSGATIVAANRPTQSPSLVDFPKADDNVRKLAGELFDEGNGGNKGIVGMPLAEVFAAKGVPADFTASSPSVMYIHRRGEDGAEIYFVSNQDYQAAEVVCTFRVSGRVPELWHPDTGLIEQAALFAPNKEGTTTVPLRLDPAGSVFVVFRKPANTAADPIAKLERESSAPAVMDAAPSFTVSRDRGDRETLTAWIPGTYRTTRLSGKAWSQTIAELPRAIDLTNVKWSLSFPPKWGAPERVELPKLIDWRDLPEDGVKHFSGTATYTIEFEVPADRLGAGHALRLNLGDVKNIAEVKLNGRDLGIVWKAPFVIDVTDTAKGGRNALEIRVTNLWPNRLIGDKSLPEDQRFTWTTADLYKADSPLLPSGLIGPVMLQSGRVIPIQKP